MPEKIIIEVGLSDEEYIRKSNGLNARLKELTENQKKLRAAGLASGDAYKQNAQEIKKLNNEQNQYLKLAQSSNGSINQLRAQLALLTAQYNALSETERDSTQSGQVLGATIRLTSDKLKEQESALGNNTRNVGNYSESVKDAIRQISPFGSTILDSADKAKVLSGGLLESAKASEVLKVAFASTGIGVLLVAFSALVNFLKQFKPLTDLIEQGVSGLKAGFTAFGRLVFDLVKPLADVFSNPLQSVKDLASFVGTNLLNRFLAFKEVALGIINLDFRRIGDGILQGFTGVEDASSKVKAFGNNVAASAKQISDAAKAAKQLTQNTQDLEDVERRSISVFANLRKERDILAAQSKNPGLDYKERARLADESAQKEQQAFRIEKQIANARVQLAKDAVNNFEKANKSEAPDDLQENLQQALAKRADYEAQSVKFTEKRYADEEKLRDRSRAAELKSWEEQLKADRVRLESADRTRALLLSGRQREEAELITGYQKQIEENRKYGATTQQLEKEKQAALKSLRLKYSTEDLKESNDYANLLAEGQLKSVKDNFQKEFELRSELINRNREFELSQKNLTETERLSIIEKYRQQQFTVEENYNLARFARESELAQQSYDFQVNLIEQEDLLQRKVSIYDRAFGVIAGLFGKNTAVGKAAFIAEKSFALASIVINTQKALALDRVAEAAQNSFLSAIPIVGAVLAGANSVKHRIDRAFIIAEGAISAGVVLSQSISGFKDGVIDFKSDGRGANVYGPGTSRSDSVNARLSNGESVINARSTQMFKPVLSAINEAGGGRSLMGYTPSFAMASGGVFLDSSAASAVQAIIDPKSLAEAITQGFSKVPAPRVAVEDINQGQNRLRVEIANATF